MQMRSLSRPFRLLAFPAVLCCVSWALAAPPILRFDEVQTGMRGVGRTVFQGTEVEEFQVEILGKLPNIGPGQNLILARCSGGPLERTGVLAGMSGSPVFVDGRLIGAVAYSWGFSREPVAGITPIEEMLALRRAGDQVALGGAVPTPEAWRAVLEPRGLKEWFHQRLAPAVLPGGASPPAFRVPVSLSGLSPRGRTELTRVLGDLPLEFLPSAAAASGSGDPAGGSKLVPGSAVGIKLVRGDVDLTATGTLTWVEGADVLALGHPLFGLGDVRLPLTAARVEALLPSLAQSAKIAVPLEEVGTVVADRAAGVAGRLGDGADMLPVRLRFESPSAERNVGFDLLRDGLLGPLLLYAVSNSVLASQERLFGSLSVRVAEGSVIKVRGHEDIRLDNLFAGEDAPYYATGTAAFILYLVLNNAWEPAEVEGVNLILEYAGTPQTARVRRVDLDRYRARPGDTVEATIVLTTYRGGTETLVHTLRIPEETPQGVLTLRIGGALPVTRAESSPEGLQPRDLDQLIWLINHLRRNDRVYIVGTLQDSGVFLGGARLPNLPASVRTILTRPASHGNFAVIGERGVLEEEIRTRYAVSGLTKVRLEVEAP